MVAPIIVAAIISAAAAAGGTAAGWNRNKGNRRVVDTYKSDQLRKRQLDLLGEYTRSAKGMTASWADLQMQKMLTQSNAAQSAQAASARGGNMVLAQRTAANVAGSNVSKIAAETARARLQEQEQNRQMAASLSDQIRARDLSIEMENLNQKNIKDTAEANRKAANKALLANAIFSVGAAVGKAAMEGGRSPAKEGAAAAAYDTAFNQAYAGSQYSAARSAQGSPSGSPTVILGSGGGYSPYANRSSYGDFYGGGAAPVAQYTAQPTPSQTYNPYDYGSNTQTGSSPYQQFQPQSGYRR